VDCTAAIPLTYPKGRERGRRGAIYGQSSRWWPSRARISSSTPLIFADALTELVVARRQRDEEEEEEQHQEEDGQLEPSSFHQVGDERDLWVTAEAFREEDGRLF